MAKHLLITSIIWAVLFGACAYGQIRPGYLITKSNLQLTGSIGYINQTEASANVEFINDFGTLYYLEPARIKGFVYFQGPEMCVYESSMWRNKWQFLRILFAGEHARLLQSPEQRVSQYYTNGRIVEVVEPYSQFWIHLPEKNRLVRINKLGYKKQLRRLVEEVSPQLAKTIGQVGYRYKDLYNILALYEAECQKGKRTL